MNLGLFGSHPVRWYSVRIAKEAPPAAAFVISALAWVEFDSGCRGGKRQNPVEPTRSRRAEAGKLSAECFGLGLPSPGPYL